MMNLRKLIIAFIIPRSSFRITAKPLDETPYAFFNRRLRVVAEEPPRFRDVGEGLRHVAGLRGPALDEGLAAQLALEQGDQLAQAHRARLAEVEDLEGARLVVDGRAHARDDVVNEGVVAPRRAVAEDGERAALADEARELVDGEVGALARAVDREEAEADRAQAPEVRVGVAEQLARRLRRRVRADGPAHGVVLGKRNLLVLAVDGGRRAEDELADIVRARKLKQVERAPDVRLGVEQRFDERRAHARARGEVNDAVKRRLAGDRFQRVAVAHVRLGETEVLAREVRRDVAALDRRVVEVVEVVNHVDAPKP